ncbi:MAG: glycosyltransferase [Planctomycetia bacterium]|nr:glycosyltransferase [Planctomycetia bacterium]
MIKQLVSVIVPVYNGERFVKFAIESILAQIYNPIEIIIVDDGSIDGSAKIAKTFKTVRYIYQENLGPSVARNTGVATSKGEFIAFLDSDDIWYPEKLKVQIEYLNKNPNIGFVFAHRKMIVEKCIAKPPWYKEHLFDNASPVLCASALLARKNVFIRTGGYNPDYRFGENAEWLTRVKDFGIKMAVLPDTLLEQRLHDKNQTYHQNEMRSNILKALKGSIDRQREREDNRD